jgi:hypothetical protein
MSIPCARLQRVLNRVKGLHPLLWRCNRRSSVSTRFKGTQGIFSKSSFVIRNSIHFVFHSNHQGVPGEAWCS